MEFEQRGSADYTIGLTALPPANLKVIIEPGNPNLQKVLRVWVKDKPPGTLAWGQVVKWIL
jgi:hypothetical protein